MNINEKIRKLITQKERELEKFEKNSELRKKKEDKNFNKQLDEDFKLKNTLNPFYKPKALKMANSSIGIILGSAIIQSKIENEINLLKSLL